MTEKTKKVVAIMLFVVLAITNFNLNSRISSLERTIQSINSSLLNNMQGLYSGQYDISNKIDSMNEQAAQNAKLSFDEAALIKGYHEAAATVDIDVSFGLKQFDSDDAVNVTARGTNGKTIDAVAVRSSAGRFSSTLALPVQDNYVLTFTTNGVSNISGELIKLNLENELCGRFKYDFGTGRTESSGKQTITSLYPSFLNFTQGNTALNIKEISLIAESGNTVIGTWDLLPYLRDEANSQTINDYQEQLKISAGENPNLSGDSKDVIEFAVPFEGATIRLAFTDNMGVRYERTDRVYGGSANSGGSSSGSYSTSSASVPVGIYGEYGDGYIHLAQPK